MNLINCSKEVFNEHYPNELYFSSQTHSQNATLILINCFSVVIENISASILAGSYALATTNVMNRLRLCDVTELMNIYELSTPE